MSVPQLLKLTDDLYYFESRTVSPFAVSGVYLILRSEVALIEAGKAVDELSALDRDEQNRILHELKAIMAVYDQEHAKL